jgi:accessory colonization factor AcfC
MKNDKIYTSSDGREFVVRKRGNNLVAVSVKDKKVSFGIINIKTERCGGGGTHCFQGLREVLKNYKTNSNQKSFRITYRMEITINASTEEEANVIFENMGGSELNIRSEFVEKVSVENMGE